MTRKVLALVIAVGALCVAIACSSQNADSGDPTGKPEPGKAATVAPAVLEQGRGIYKAHCAACHGDDGRGDGPAAGVMKPPPRDHTDRAYMDTLTDEDLTKIIVMGGAMKGKPLMPSHPQFTGEKLAALVAYTRSLSTSTGNEHGAKDDRERKSDE